MFKPSNTKKLNNGVSKLMKGLGAGLAKVMEKTVANQTKEEKQLAYVEKEILSRRPFKYTKWDFIKGFLACASCRNKCKSKSSK